MTMSKTMKTMTDQELNRIDLGLTKVVLRREDLQEGDLGWIKLKDYGWTKLIVGDLPNKTLDKE